MKPSIGRKATVTLTGPIALGDMDQISGYVTEHNTGGTRIFDRADGRGRSQWFPGHLVKSVDFEDEKESQ